ncbi:unnamed protein product [Psylliodes chrysocephalus]|uniref:Uncharacterized protein n=1 Tax=Psylliodes chrysocephalus TaxID=3402493 RepID=A0A9P0DB38_9CUCU|nr:unnamed protein product [Psylliodes chrysocephala]
MIDIEKFSAYASETAELYVNLYNWHPMTPTVHKILVHGATVISEASLTIVYLSEKAAEARNKHFRLYRLNFTRKFSREICNRDTLNRLLLTSDHVTWKQKQAQRRKKVDQKQKKLKIRKRNN